MTTLIILILLILAAFILGWLISRLLFKGGSTSHDDNISSVIAEREAELASCRNDNETLKTKISLTKSIVAEAPSASIAPEITVEVAPVVNTIVESAPVVNTIAEPTRVDDLKIVEGIGPKIEELLNNANIKTFAHLEGTSVERLNAILAEAGPRYQMHDPATWPQQSGLANNGKWTELKILQDELNKGKVE